LNFYETPVSTVENPPGFLNRNSSKSGRAILANRRRQGRKRLTPV
jgi:ribosomal protein L34